MFNRIKIILQDRSGTSMVEFSLVMLTFFTIVGGLVDFSVVVYKFNAATKAAYQGARLASVSDPVSSDLKTLTGLGGNVNPGDPFPAFIRVCSGATQTCSGGTYDATAMSDLVYGRGKTTCGTTLGADNFAGMCKAFTHITPANVIVTYQSQAGLGFAGRPGSNGRTGGAVPIITVQLTGLTASLPFVGSILGLGPITFPPLETTAIGEDMNSTAD